MQRELDPVTAVIQRRQTEHDVAAAMGFLGGPAASIDDSIVQLKTDAHTGLSDDAIGAHAAAGVTGGGQPLPHLDAIQRSFGPHDVTGVRAHVGGAAADASSTIGAHAYATGNDVAFAREPDLFLAAHEAAHVVQQRRGVQLKGAVGQSGDEYERHADEVAAAVVRGESAAELLGSRAPGRSDHGEVQRNETSAAAPKVPHHVTTVAGGAAAEWKVAVANVRQQIANAHDLMGLALDIVTTDLLGQITPKNGWTMLAGLAKAVLPLLTAVTTGPISNFMMVDPRDVAALTAGAVTGLTAESVKKAALANVESMLVAKAGSFVEEQLGSLVDKAGAASENLPNPSAGIERAREANIKDKNARVAAIEKSGDNDAGWAVLRSLAAETAAMASASVDALIARTINAHATVNVAVSSGLGADDIPGLDEVKGMNYNDGVLGMAFSFETPNMFFSDPGLPFSLRDALKGQGPATLDLAVTGIPQQAANRLLALRLSDITLPKKVWIQYGGTQLTVTFDGKQNWSFTGDFSPFWSLNESADQSDATDQKAMSNLGASAVVAALQRGTMAGFGFDGIVDTP